MEEGPTEVPLILPPRVRLPEPRLHAVAEHGRALVQLFEEPPLVVLPTERLRVQHAVARLHHHIRPHNRLHHAPCPPLVQIARAEPAREDEHRHDKVVAHRDGHKGEPRPVRDVREQKVGEHHLQHQVRLEVVHPVALGQPPHDSEAAGEVGRGPRRVRVAPGGFARALDERRALARTRRLDAAAAHGAQKLRFEGVHQIRLRRRLHHRLLLSTRTCHPLHAF
mmetsp:Transcript_28348/g.92579  ORF Transcript_28348/g.92579 Transcript_28348/m.92579 type:complete len:223 (+) Transcript_28348:983-1651(+)